ncbi:MAG: YraN family protein [Spirochaetia bacterium]|nr:YraN family protein [Spirochaetia bacterium]
MPENSEKFRHPGELRALAHFQSLGYEIVSHNFHAGFAEIDLIVRDLEGTIHFIEVKAYAGETHPLETFTKQKTSRMKRAAGRFLSEQSEREGQSSVTFGLAWVKENEIVYYPGLYVQFRLHGSTDGNSVTGK